MTTLYPLASSGEETPCLLLDQSSGGVHRLRGTGTMNLVQPLMGLQCTGFSHLDSERLEPSQSRSNEFELEVIIT